MTELLNASGYLTKSYKYDAFGNIISETGPAFNRGFTYTGRERHARSGFYYYRARFYDPQTGRFITPDPIGHLGGVNLYGYVGNSPVDYVDPFGLVLTCKGYFGVVLLGTGGVLILNKAVIPGAVVGGIGGVLIIWDLADSQKKIEEMQEQKKKIQEQPPDGKITPLSPYQNQPGVFPPDMEEEGTDEQFRNRGREDLNDIYDSRK